MSGPHDVPVPAPPVVHTAPGDLGAHCVPSGLLRGARLRHRAEPHHPESLQAGNLFILFHIIENLVL